MLIFKKITYCNFLSTGNVKNTIDLNKHSSTLIAGKNGEGKSTILCALTFALFGKPFRNVNKGQLVNSINRKNCLVEVEFETNGVDYIIKRGIKPNVFEIWQNGEMINQDAALKDYQKVLEQQILKLNYKTFTQVVILGSATFVPFMQLPTGQRREVIEDILDIRVFSVMNQLLKERVQATRDELTKIEDALLLSKEKANAQKKLIQTISTAKTETIDRLQVKISDATRQITETTDKRESILREIEGLSASVSDYDELSENIRKANRAVAKIESQHTALEDHIKFIQENSVCPSCDQEIPDTHKKVKIAESKEALSTHQTDKVSLEKALAKLVAKVNKINKTNRELTDKNIEVSTYNNTVSILQSQISQLTNEIEQLIGDTSNVDVEKNRLRDIADDAIKLVEKKNQLLDTKNLHDVASVLLKDTGIKTAIIREYLPVMNKLISKYLDAMNLYVSFELDESFNEVIKSRNRDEFTYASFSEGEKRRIDLAILFTWRQIAKMKNSVNTNLLFLDEILDSSLDATGIDYFLSIMNDFGNHTNVFVISHRSDQVADKFNHTVNVYKKGDFSVVESSS